MEISYLLYVLIGKLIIYFGMKFPPLANSRNNFVKQLFSCDECLGLWVYSLLAVVIIPREGYIEEMTTHIRVLDSLFIGMLTTFLVHLISVGWREKFSVYEIK